MSDSLRDSSASSHLLSSDIKRRMAKAASNDVRKADLDEQWKAAVGRAIDAVRAEQQLSLKEFADAITRDERQVARWIGGKEHAQIAAVFAVVQFRQPLVLALAKIAGQGVEIETVIRIKRTA